jgi:hypothetical protein
VLNSVTRKNFDIPIIHFDREVNRELALGVPDFFNDARVQFQVSGRNVHLFHGHIQRIDFLSFAHRQDRLLFMRFDISNQ